MRTNQALCWGCHKEVPKDQLSHAHLCYDCAEARMIAWFNEMWYVKHKKEVKDESIENLRPSRGTEKRV